MITIKVFGTTGFNKVQRQYQIAQMWDDLASHVYDLLSGDPEFITPITAEIIYPWGYSQELFF